MNNRIASFLLGILLLGILSVPVSGTQPSSDPALGSITVGMRIGQSVVPGGSITLYRVADASIADDGVLFTPTGDFTACGESFADFVSAELAQNLRNYAWNNELRGIPGQIGTDGMVTFSDLEPGLYLLVQDTPAEGYNPVKPFLVSVPQQQNGGYVYEVHASPKLTPSDAPTVPTAPPATEPPSVGPGDENLPQTGQLNWPVPLLASLGLGLFALGWMLCFGGRKERNEA